MTDFKGFVANKLKNEEFRSEYEALEPEFSIVHAIINSRKCSGITQKQLAERAGMAQGDISKIENGHGNPSLRTLKRLASAMEMRLKVEFEPIASK